MPRTRDAVLHDLAVSDATRTALNEAYRSALTLGEQVEADIYADNLRLINRRHTALLDELHAVDEDAALDAVDDAIQDTEHQIIATVRAADPTGARHLTDTEILTAVQDRYPTATDHHDPATYDAATYDADDAFGT